MSCTLNTHSMNQTVNSNPFADHPNYQSTKPANASSLHGKLFAIVPKERDEKSSAANVHECFFFYVENGKLTFTSISAETLSPGRWKLKNGQPSLTIVGEIVEFKNGQPSLTVKKDMAKFMAGIISHYISKEPDSNSSSFNEKSSARPIIVNS